MDSLIAATPPPPWYRLMFADRNRSSRAVIVLVVGLLAAWSLQAADFGALQSAFALATILAAVASLGLEGLVRERLVQKPDETTATLGTGMALRCIAGGLLYACVVMGSSPTQQSPRAVWLVATLLVVLQTPLLLGLRLEDLAQRQRAVFAQNFGFGLSAVMTLVLIWRGADAVWFASAILLEQPISGLLLLYGHGRIAPEEDAFTWDWDAAKSWMRRCWKPLGHSLLPLAIIPVAQLVVVARSAQDKTGTFAVAALLFDFAAFALTAILIGRMGRSAPAPKTEATATDSELANTFHASALTSWIGAIATAAAAALLAFTVFNNKAFDGLKSVGPVLALGLAPFGLGLVRDELWRRAGHERLATKIRLITAALSAGSLVWTAHQWGAIGAAISVTLSLILGEWIVPLWFKAPVARKIAQAQLRAATLRGRPVPPAPAKASIAPEATAEAAPTALAVSLSKPPFPLAGRSIPPIPLAASLQNSPPGALPKAPGT